MAEGKHGVVFAEGVHYPVGEDGHADLSRPLRRTDDNTDWRPAEEGEPLHNDVHHQSSVELEPGSEDEL